MIDVAPSPYELLDRKELFSALDEVMESLTRQCEIAFYCRVVLGMSYDMMRYYVGSCDEWAVSRERARQIFAKACRELNAPGRLNLLREWATDG